MPGLEGLKEIGTLDLYQQIKALHQILKDLPQIVLQYPDSYSFIPSNLGIKF